MTKPLVLIVDDQPENINLLANLLEDKYRILRARDAAAGLALFRKHPVDAILTDQRMPGMNGVEFLEKARAIRSECVRMLVTAYPDVNDAIEAINRGNVHRYIAKPFDGGELRLALEKELGHFQLLSANRRLNEELGRMVDELFKANRELSEVNRMKDQFLANCSHELKTPLVSGLGYLDLILSAGMGPVEPRQEKGLKIAQRNLQRLLALIESLLALAKARFCPDTLKKARFALKPLIEECVESLKGRAKKASLEVNVRIPRSLPPIEGDERKIHSVITNVLANAEKFSPERARIEIRVSPPRAGRVGVEVHDNGDGPEDPDGGIQPFKTSADPRFAGMGIGLSMAREFLKAHGGTIRLGRAPGGGARVEFDLPAAPAPRRKR